MSRSPLRTNFVFNLLFPLARLAVQFLTDIHAPLWRRVLSRDLGQNLARVGAAPLTRTTRPRHMETEQKLDGPCKRHAGRYS